MNNISALQQLVSKTIKVKIPKQPTEYQTQVEVEIKKLPLNKLSLLNFSKNDAELPVPELIEKMTPLFEECLGVTKEELKNISIDYIMELMEVIMEINMPNNKSDEKQALLDKMINRKQE
jgi:ketopantoate reductase